MSLHSREREHFDGPFHCCSITQSCLTLCNPMNCTTPGFPVLHCLLELAQTHVHWIGDAIQPSYPLSPASPPALNLSQHRSFPMSWLFASGGQSVGACFSNSHSSENSGLISFRIDWFDLAVQGILKCLLQHHNSKVSILWHSAFIYVSNSLCYIPETTTIFESKDKRLTFLN